MIHKSLTEGDDSRAGIAAHIVCGVGSVQNRATYVKCFCSQPRALDILVVLVPICNLGEWIAQVGHLGLHNNFLLNSQKQQPLLYIVGTRVWNTNGCAINSTYSIHLVLHHPRGGDVADLTWVLSFSCHFVAMDFVHSFHRERMWTLNVCKPLLV